MGRWLKKQISVSVWRLNKQFFLFLYDKVETVLNTALCFAVFNLINVTPLPRRYFPFTVKQITGRHNRTLKQLYYYNNILNFF